MIKLPEIPDLPPIPPKYAPYISLMRLDKPIGIYLVMWPTLWSLWLAAEGVPSLGVLVIFVLGCVLMRSAGCVINDYADKSIDGHVERTADRPLANGAVAPSTALKLFVALSVIAFCLVLLTNTLTIMLSFGAIALAATYPFMKRWTYLPQVVLGAAFAWSIPMAFAAQSNTLPANIWLLYVAVVMWTVAYDTFYAMVDREDDLKIGVKSTAILFGEMDKMMTGSLQAMVIIAMWMVGNRFELGWIYFLSLCVAAGLFGYQQYLIRERSREGCFQAFLNNHWVGMTIFLGIVLAYIFK